jgi:hypothetical protein
MKKTSYILAAFLLFSCYSRQADEQEKIILNKAVFGNLKSQSGGNYIIFSCTSCSCFNSVLKLLSRADKDYLSQFTLIADTMCTKSDLPFMPVKQSLIDSISTDIFNVTLVRKIDGNYDCRIIQTGECEKLIPICRKYFK